MFPALPVRPSGPTVCGRLAAVGRALRAGRWAIGLALVGVLAACSGERPTLVEAPAATVAADDQPVDGTPTASTSPTTAAPLPERSDCSTVTGPGPARFDLADDSVPCLAVAGHHRVELGNPGPAPLELTVGSVSVTVEAGASQLTDQAGALLVGGPNRILAGGATVATVWLIEATEDPLAGSEIGLRSIGAIELGQEPAEVTAAAGGIPVSAAGTPCHLTTLDADPYSPLFTFRDGKLAVVQIYNPGVATLSGIRVGASLADVEAAYSGRLEALPPPDGDQARQLLAFVPSDEEDQIYRLVFDLTDGLVTTMRFGATEIVADQPGCGS